MLKKTITYVDYNGVSRTEDYWFHLTMAELYEMQLIVTGGMQQKLDNIVKAQDQKGMIETFKDILLRSYGVKTDDGRGFTKVRDGHRLSEDFSQTEAYSILFMELATNDDSATAFINGVIPQNMAEELAKASQA